GGQQRGLDRETLEDDVELHQERDDRLLLLLKVRLHPLVEVAREAVREAAVETFVLEAGVGEGLVEPVGRWSLLLAGHRFGRGGTGRGTGCKLVGGELGRRGEG